MKHLRNEKGIALVMVLILAAIALAIISGLVYMITAGTQISGVQKHYKTAFDAGMGGVDVTFRLIAERGDPHILGISFIQTATDNCLANKLNWTTSAANWSSCAAYAEATSVTIDPTDPNSYDFQFELGATPPYTVYSKIVNTVEGNSGGDEGLIGKGVVAAGSGEITVMSIPYLYTLEVDAQNANNPAERAKFSVLYQY
jgi:hypothetical protein